MKNSVLVTLALTAAWLVVPPLLGVTDPASGSTIAAAQASPQPRGAYSWPLPGRPAVTRSFDAPDGPYGSGHRGVDLVGVPGEEVLAAGTGVVSFAGVVAGRGVVSVQHPDGLRTTYEPVEPVVLIGAVVAREQVIGTLAAGHPGCAAPACLHWGVRRDGDGTGPSAYLDPLRLVGRWSVRLVPVGGG